MLVEQCRNYMYVSEKVLLKLTLPLTFISILKHYFLIILKWCLYKPFLFNGFFFFYAIAQSRAFLPRTQFRIKFHDVAKRHTVLNQVLTYTL